MVAIDKKYLTFIYINYKLQRTKNVKLWQPGSNRTHIWYSGYALAGNFQFYMKWKRSGIFYILYV